MKAAFGILALYVSIPLAIVAAQSVVAHQATEVQGVQHASAARLDLGTAPGAARLATK